jgi:hypothetical protein
LVGEHKECGHSIFIYILGYIYIYNYKHKYKYVHTSKYNIW